MFKFKSKKATFTTLKSDKTDNDNQSVVQSKSINDKTIYSVSCDFGNNNLNKEDIDLVKEYLISRCKYNISELIEKYPCRFTQGHKKKIYQNIIKHQAKNGKIDSNKLSYFIRWKQLNENNKSLSTLNENNDIDDLSSKFAKIFGKNPNIDIEEQKNDNNESKKDTENKQKKKTITTHIYEENVFEYNDNIKGVKSEIESKNNDDNQSKTKSISWYLNFAHSNLFIAYRGMLLAQDELQVLEHPFLGSLRECMVNHGKASKENVAFLSRESGYSTPCLFTNVPRQCHIDTVPNTKIKGREKGLYGNAFNRCKDFDVIESAVNLLTPVTYSNIIAIEAPTGGYGTYSLKDLDYIFYCALTAFTAARIESEILWKEDKNDKIEVVIHTGNWGTGAYGGNKELMSLLQMLAADFSGVDRLIYHTFSKMFTVPYIKALKVRERYVDNKGNILRDWDYIRNELLEMKYKWGVSDGN